MVPVRIETTSTDYNSYPVERVFFENLKTYNGKELPKFKRPPFIEMQANEVTFGGMAKNITTESFTVPVLDEKVTYYLWILSED